MDSETPSLILLNGRVFTAAPGDDGRATAVAVSGDRIAAVGDDRAVSALAGPGAEVIDLAGKSVLPGFHDGHLHPLWGAVDLIECRLAESVSAADCLARVRAYAERHPDRRFLRGGGWRNDFFPPHGPHRRDLDAIAPDRPVFLKSVDGHSAWVNTRALDLAGISNATPDPPGGHIERDERGEATGTLREWTAMEPVSRRLPPPTRAERQEGLLLFMDLAAAAGITSLHEAMAEPGFLDIYASAAEQGQLLQRVSASLSATPATTAADRAAFAAERARHVGDLVQARSVKLFIDGVIEAHTAALLEPYNDRPESRGEPLWAPAQLNEMITALDREGWQVHMHAVGDAAVRLALDGVAAARAANGPRDARHVIAHNDLVDDADLARFASLGVTANFEPAWFFRDQLFDSITLPFLGADRAGRLYRIRSLLASGAVVTVGSDWPVGGELVTFKPLESLQVGGTRSGLAGREPVDSPGERVDLATLVGCATRRAAWSDFREQATGTLAPGKYADLVVLDRDLFSAPPGEIHQARVLLTLMAGRATFRSPLF